MAQTGLTEFAADGLNGCVIDQLRERNEVLWFPDSDQRVIIYFEPRDDAGEDDPDPAPWAKILVDSQGVHRLKTWQVSERLGADSEEFDYELVSMQRCSTCKNPMPPHERVTSTTTWIEEVFCSATCLHECEFALDVDLSPTQASTTQTVPQLHVHWEKTGVSYVDAELPGP